MRMVAQSVVPTEPSYLHMGYVAGAPPVTMSSFGGFVVLLLVAIVVAFELLNEARRRVIALALLVGIAAAVCTFRS